MDINPDCNDAIRLALEIDSEIDPDKVPDYVCELAQVYTGTANPSHQLRYSLQGLALHSCAPDRSKQQVSETRVDFLSTGFVHRLKTSGKNQGIGKAVGLNKGYFPSVLDVTAGLGKDAFVLAYLGCSLLMTERSAIVHALLADGLARAIEDPELDAVVARMDLLQMDGADYLDRIMAGSADPVDVVFLDPMYPARSKSASVKKDIALLQEVLGTDDDADALLDKALRCARKRVVLKRPGKKFTGVGRKPDFQIPGKSSHFEVYLPEIESSA